MKKPPSKLVTAAKIIIPLLIASSGLGFALNNQLSNKSSIAENQLAKKFDLYILATQWIPGWCETSTGKSGAELDDTRACQQQSNRPLMYHGLWPENIDGSYPADCSAVPQLDPSKLSFSNPFTNYLLNAAKFLDHEWSKHGTCSPYYTSGSESRNSLEYYQQVNNYFTSSIQMANKINIPTLALEIKATDLIAQIHQTNSQINPAAIIIKCDLDSNVDQQYLTGLWLCVNKTLQYTPCPLALQKTSCRGTLLTR